MRPLIISFFIVGIALLALSSGERPARADLPPRPVGWTQTQVESIQVLDLPEPTIVLPRRRRAFQLRRTGLVPTVSPLDALPPGDRCFDVEPIDADGDGTLELLVILERPGVGAGFALLELTRL